MIERKYHAQMSENSHENHHYMMIGLYYYRSHYTECDVMENYVCEINMSINYIVGNFFKTSEWVVNVLI